MLGALVVSFAAHAQHPTPRVSLVPGGSDTIHDISGVAIGMACQEALAVAAKVSADKGRYSNVKRQSTMRAKGDRAGTDYQFTIYDVPLNLYQGSISTDNLKFSCLEMGNRPVFEVTRQMRFGAYNVGNAPPMASIRALFQEKYGVPTVEFTPYSFATMFNRKGPVTDKNSCGPYQNNNLYLRGFEQSDSDTCSYALTFAAQPERGKPDTVEYINIVIRDFIRLQNAVREGDKTKTQNTPVVMPKF